MIKENNEMHGALTVRLTDRQGQVVHHRKYKNHIVTSGRQLVAQLFAGQAGSVPATQVTHIAVGTDATDPTDADTTLLAERDPRKPIENINYEEIDEGGVQRVRTSLTAVFDFDDANGTAPFDTAPLREAGLFTAEPGEVMYSRVVFEPVTKTDAFKLTLLWDIVF